VTFRVQNDDNFPFWAARSAFSCGSTALWAVLLVENRTQDGDGEVVKICGAFVELQPTHDAVVAEVFGGASFGDAEMVGQERLQVGVARLVIPERAKLPIAMRSVSQASTYSRWSYRRR